MVSAKKVLPVALALSSLFLAVACSSTNLPVHAEYEIDQRHSYEKGFYKDDRIADFYLSDGSNYYSSLKPGSANLLLFWADWCPHCTSLVERMVASPVRDKVASNLVAVAEETSDLKKIEALAPRLRFQDENWRVFDQQGLEHVPALFVVDGSGRVLGSAEGGEACESLLKQYESNLDKSNEEG